MIENLDELLQAAAGLEARRALVVAPANAESFGAIVEARERLGLEFLLVGDRRRIEAAIAADAGIEIVDSPDVGGCVQSAVELLGRGEAGILMKGSIDTATLIKAALRPESGLRTGRLLSDAFVFEYAARSGNKLVIITDGGLNIAPDLDAKLQIIQNAVEVAHALGNRSPKVAMIAATEFVQANMPATIDAAILAKMSQRGQIRGCMVDGPFALDAALTAEAAAEKHLTSKVAGAAEILVCPNIECANALAKSTTYVGKARLAHVVVGARIPILIPSRADTKDAKLLSLALGMLMSAASIQGSIS